MTIRTKDLTFIEVKSVCDGGSINALTKSQCLVPLTTLALPPYNLVFNDGICYQVSATNFFGESPVSNTGCGALMLVVPNAPVKITKNSSLSSQSVISFSWS